MSILIKGMEMPKSCDECPCLADHYKACNLTGNYFTEPTMIHKNRLPNCPLVEIPSDDAVDSNMYRTVLGEMQRLADKVIKIREIVG